MGAELGVVITLAVGVALVILSLKLLDYTFDRTDYLFDVGVFGGFIVFFIGVYAALCAFFPIYSPIWLGGRG